MRQTNPVKLAKVLRIFVTITFICNLLVLPLVPGIVGISSGGGILALREAMAGSSLVKPLVFLSVCWQYLWRVWRVEYSAVLSAFLLFCGSGTAVILWQARGVLGTIVKENTFTLINAKRLQRAAVCCFLITAAALARTVWGLVHYGTSAPLFTYNTLFIPLFAMGGLLCMVMSALFRQAAELKEENDLTI